MLRRRRNPRLCSVKLGSGCHQVYSVPPTSDNASCSHDCSTGQITRSHEVHTSFGGVVLSCGVGGRGGGLRTGLGTSIVVGIGVGCVN